jgi:hypothetical protein
LHILGRLFGGDEFGFVDGGQFERHRRGSCKMNR